MREIRDLDEPRSRRDRPAKPPLGRAVITEAALELVRQNGLDSVTLRRVADRLDTGPASLYVYVANREALLERMFDRVLSEVPRVAVKPRSWQEGLVELFSAMLAALDRYPGIAQVGLGAMATTPGGLAISENALALLRAGGVADQAAAWACDALLLFTVATGVEHAIERRPTLPGHKSPDRDYVGAARELFRSLPSDRYPTLNRMAVAMTTGGDVERFEFGLTALIRGARDGEGQTSGA
ncbi:MAG: TetR/AcrR family transcriptional regulator [Solirubrobacteraceae bacterium]